MTDLIPEHLNNNSSTIPNLEINAEDINALNLQCTDTTGTDLMLCMLLEQYKNSELLIRYIHSFVKEIDILFCEAKKVQLGRYLDYAEGKQLDVIGEILNVERKAVILGDYFGFLGHDQADSFSQIDPNTGVANPSIGEEFISGTDSGVLILPLADNLYRNIIKARAFCVGFYNRNIEGGVYTDYIESTTVESLFKIVSIVFKGNYDTYTLDGYITDFSITYNSGETSINLELNSSINEEKMNVLYSIRDWFIPFTMKFNLTKQI